MGSNTCHDLVRLDVLAENLRVVSSGGEIADRIVELILPELMHARPLEDGRILQAERPELVRLVTQISQRLGQMIGR